MASQLCSLPSTVLDSVSREIHDLQLKLYRPPKRFRKTKWPPTASRQSESKAHRPPKHADRGTSKTTLRQQQSLLLRLPKEIRLLTYQFVYENERCHLTLFYDNAESGNRFRAITCLQNKDCRKFWPTVAERFEKSMYGISMRYDQVKDRAWHGIDQSPDCLPEMRDGFPDKSRSRSWPQLRPLALAMTCRLLYPEVIDMLYQNLHFDFSPADAFAFEFRKLVSPHQFYNIRRLSLSTSIVDFRHKRGRLESSLSIIANMHLQDLYVCFLDSGFPPPKIPRDSEERLLAPLKKARVARDYIVVLDWFTKEQGLPEIEGPFRLERDGCLNIRWNTVYE